MEYDYGSSVYCGKFVRLLPKQRKNTYLHCIISFAITISNWCWMNSFPVLKYMSVYGLNMMNNEDCRYHQYRLEDFYVNVQNMSHFHARTISAGRAKLRDEF